jgi:hypothetical protein
MYAPEVLVAELADVPVEIPATVLGTESGVFPISRRLIGLLAPDAGLAYLAA